METRDPADLIINSNKINTKSAKERINLKVFLETDFFDALCRTSHFGDSYNS